MAKGTKELIIENTRAYLKSLGVLKSVSLSMILKAIGISKGTFYHYFKDKDELFYEVFIPEMKQKEIIFTKELSKLPTLRERLHFMFNLLIDDKYEKELNDMENFTIYFFFESSDIGKLKVFKTIHDEISKTRKSLIMQQIRYYNIKITKDISILVDYVDDTMIFYHIFNKKIRDKAPKREIIAVIDVLCRLIENAGKKSAKKRESKQNAIDL